MKFAKLFEVDGRQVLLHRGVDENDDPILYSQFELSDDKYMSLMERFPASEDGVKARDKAFDEYEQMHAEVMWLRAMVEAEGEVK